MKLLGQTFRPIKFITCIQLCAAILTSLSAQPAAPSADADYAAFQTLAKETPPGLPKDIGAKKYLTWMDAHRQAVKSAALAFQAAYPHDARRWELVMAAVTAPPYFIKAIGPDVAEGLPKMVIDEAAATAWRAKVAELKAAMAQATDVPPEIVAAAAKDAKDREERSATRRAPFAKWRSGQEVAPDFPMQDLAGREVRLADFRGKVVVLDFWATWCSPCKAAMPYNQETAAKYKTQGVVVIASCTRDRRENFEKWVKANQPTYPDIVWVHDPAAMEEQRAAKRLYDTPGIPCQFVIDREGRVVDVVFGYMNGEVLLEAALAKAGIRVDDTTLAQAKAEWKRRTDDGMDY